MDELIGERKGGEKPTGDDSAFIVNVQRRKFFERLSMWPYDADPCVLDFPAEKQLVRFTGGAIETEKWRQ